MKYRAEIDGLRAIAVLPVILFHAGVETFSGGYLGVDIFFVISGYLITTIILEELHKTGHFSLSGFYVRRVRRIFPALAFMTLLCIAAAWVWLPANAMKDFALSLVGVATFSSNFIFWQQSGYFDTAAELKPLLHTWSLAVEEQYYIFFPFVMMLIWRFGARAVWGVFLLAILVSLGLAQWASDEASVAGFFLLPTRGWELLLGACCALYLHKSSIGGRKLLFGAQGAQLLSALGLGLIVFAIFCFDEATPTPSILTLVPTMGAALIILFANVDTWAKKILAFKPLVGIGLISYSAYLWHQPVFVFYRYNVLVEPSVLIMLGLSALSLIAGWASWRYVETPFRKKGVISTRTVYGLALLFSVLIIVFGLQGYKNGGFAQRAAVALPDNLEWESLGDKLRKQGEVCKPEHLPDTQYLLGCTFGDTDSDQIMVLYGDSHAQAVHETLDQALKKRNIKGLRLEIKECEGIPYFHKNGHLKVENCAQRYNALLSYVQALSADVFMIYRWSFRMFPLHGYNVTMPYKNSEGHIENESYREYAIYYNSELSYEPEDKARVLKVFIDKMAQVSNRLYLVYPVPEMAIDTLRANIIHRNHTGKILPEISIPYHDYQSRNEFVLSVFDQLDGANITRIKPADMFCDTFVEDRCIAQYDGVPYYLDDDHLSNKGAQMIVERVFEGP